jgi:hypothetical protein
VFFSLENASKYFFFKKLIFNISTSKQFKNNKKINLKQKKFKKFQKHGCTAMPNNAQF